MGLTPSSSEGGSGPASGSYLPAADTTDATLDTTTYDNSVRGSGKLRTLVVTGAAEAVFAVARSGDAFPRLILASDKSQFLSLSDGTVDPYNSGAWFDVVNAGGVRQFRIFGSNASRVTVGGSDANVGAFNSTNKPLQVQVGFIQSGAGVPAVGGNVGDLYIRTDGGVATYIYRCTVAGAAGAATWVAHI